MPREEPKNLMITRKIAVPGTLAFTATHITKTPTGSLVTITSSH